MENGINKNIFSFIKPKIDYQMKFNSIYNNFKK